MCSVVAKKVISYYTSSNSAVHCVFLDASKAFDKLEYCKLFKLLLDRHIPPQVIRILLNIYTGQQIRVLWNGIYSPTFAVKNGVKQGAIVSPILFCVYFDTLLTKLRSSKVGCFIGNWFVAALAYADDLVILAPTARAMRRLLAICDCFAVEYNVTFNNLKSKCITFNPHLKARSESELPPAFEIAGNSIGTVKQWLHLGHIFSSDLSDDADILSRRNHFIGQVNSFFGHFSKLDASTRDTLFKVYCSSHYGCELWNLTNVKVEDYCVAWRKGVRKIWSLPHNSSSLNVSLVSNSLPIFEEICRRMMNFLYSCLHNESDLIRYVVSFGIDVLHMNSIVGRNVVFCSDRFKTHVNSVGYSKISSHAMFERFLSDVQPNMRAQADVLHEAVLIRDGTLTLPKNSLTYGEITTLINALAI